MCRWWFKAQKNQPRVDRPVAPLAPAGDRCPVTPPMSSPPGLITGILQCRPHGLIEPKVPFVTVPVMFVPLRRVQASNMGAGGNFEVNDHDEVPAKPPGPSGRGNNAACTLCYRNCLLKPGETGWCKIRHPEHGVISNAQPHLKSPRATSHPATDLFDSCPRCWMGQVNA